MLREKQGGGFLMETKSKGSRRRRGRRQSLKHSEWQHEEWVAPSFDSCSPRGIVISLRRLYPRVQAKAVGERVDCSCSVNKMRGRSFRIIKDVVRGV